MVGAQNSMHTNNFFLFIILEDISPFRGATDIPILDFSSRELGVLCQGGLGGGHTHAQSDITSAQSGHIGTQKNFYHL